MTPNDGWDWPFLMYVATVILGRTERQFWKMTPRKLSALAKAHVTYHGGDKEDEGASPTSSIPQQRQKDTFGHIDQIIF